MRRRFCAVSLSKHFVSQCLTEKDALNTHLKPQGRLAARPQDRLRSAWCCCCSRRLPTCRKEQAPAAAWRLRSILSMECLGLHLDAHRGPSTTTEPQKDCFASAPSASLTPRSFGNKDIMRLLWPSSLGSPSGLPLGCGEEPRSSRCRFIGKMLRCTTPWVFAKPVAPCCFSTP